MDDSGAETAALSTQAMKAPKPIDTPKWPLGHPKTPGAPTESSTAAQQNSDVPLLERPPEDGESSIIESEKHRGTDTTTPNRFIQLTPVSSRGPFLAHRRSVSSTSSRSATSATSIADVSDGSAKKVPNAEGLMPWQVARRERLGRDACVTPFRSRSTSIASGDRRVSARSSLSISPSASIRARHRSDSVPDQLPKRSADSPKVGDKTPYFSRLYAWRAKRAAKLQDHAKSEATIDARYVAPIVSTIETNRSDAPAVIVERLMRGDLGKSPVYQRGQAVVHDSSSTTIKPDESGPLGSDRATQEYPIPDLNPYVTRVRSVITPAVEVQPPTPSTTGFSVQGEPPTSPTEMLLNRRVMIDAYASEWLKAANRGDGRPLKRASISLKEEAWTNVYRHFLETLKYRDADRETNMAVVGKSIIRSLECTHLDLRQRHTETLLEIGKLDQQLMSNLHAQQKLSSNHVQEIADFKFELKTARAARLKYEILCENMERDHEIELQEQANKVKNQRIEMKTLQDETKALHRAELTQNAAKHDAQVAILEEKLAREQARLRTTSILASVWKGDDSKSSVADKALSELCSTLQRQKSEQDTEILTLKQQLGTMEMACHEHISQSLIEKHTDAKNVVISSQDPASSRQSFTAMIRNPLSKITTYMHLGRNKATRQESPKPVAVTQAVQGVFHQQRYLVAMMHLIRDDRSSAKRNFQSLLEVVSAILMLETGDTSANANTCLRLKCKYWLAVIELDDGEAPVVAMAQCLVSLEETRIGLRRIQPSTIESGEALQRVMDTMTELNKRLDASEGCMNA